MLEVTIMDNRFLVNGLINKKKLYTYLRKAILIRAQKYKYEHPHIKRHFYFNQLRQLCTYILFQFMSFTMSMKISKTSNIFINGNLVSTT